MNNRSWHLQLLCLFTSLALLGCKERHAPNSEVSDAKFDDPASMNSGDEVVIETSNSAAFQKKMEGINRAKSSIDIGYFILRMDYSSSYMMLRLVEKAREGVKVRILIDALDAVASTGYFKAMIAKSKGNLRIAYYRPVDQVIIRDLEKIGVWDLMKAGKLQTRWIDLDFLKQNLSTKVIMNMVPLFVPAPGDLQPEIEQDAPSGLGKFLRSISADNINARMNAWMNATKRYHQKHIVIDQQEVYGGGRNVADDYHLDWDHPLREKKSHSFVDIDYFAKSPTLAKALLVTYNQLWDCTTGGSTACLSGVPIYEEKGELSADQTEVLWNDLNRKYKAYTANQNYGRYYADTRDQRFEIRGASLSYVENRMYPKDSNDQVFLNEEPSQFEKKWVELINNTTAGETVIFENAYVLFSADVFQALITAIHRGVNVSVYTNSLKSSDNKVITLLARSQNRVLMSAGLESEGAFNLYEYNGPQTIHAKTTKIGDTLIVGSNNADPRSAYLNMENGVVIAGGGAATHKERKFSSAAKAYEAWFTEQMASMTKKTWDQKPFVIHQTMGSLLKELIADDWKDYLGIALQEKLYSYYTKAPKDPKTRNWLTRHLMQQL